MAPQDWQYPWQKHKSDVKGRWDLCDAWAFSLWDDAGTLRALRASQPWTRTRSIAEVELSEADGLIMASASSMGAAGHNDWWPSSDDADHGGNVIEEASE